MHLGYMRSAHSLKKKRTLVHVRMILIVDTKVEQQADYNNGNGYR